MRGGGYGDSPLSSPFLPSLALALFPIFSLMLGLEYLFWLKGFGFFSSVCDMALSTQDLTFQAVFTH